MHVAHDLSTAQARVYRIADNQANIAGCDEALLPLELAGPKEMDFDLGLLGFDPTELDRSLTGDGTRGLADPEEVPEPPETPVTRPEELWLLGEHLLRCGVVMCKAM